MGDNIPDKLYLAVICFLIILLVLSAILSLKQAESPQNELKEGLALVRQNSLLPIAVPAFLKPTIHGDLVDCLAWHESRNNPKSVGKAGECGELQFMPSTFQHFCVEKYLLPDDIWDNGIQRICADYMLQDDLGFHWTTAGFCLK